MIRNVLKSIEKPIRSQVQLVSCMHSPEQHVPVAPESSNCTPVDTAAPPTRGLTPTTSLPRPICGTNLGGPFQSAYGSIPELHALDLLLEDRYEDNVEIADLDLVTGRLNPEKIRSSHPQRLHPALSKRRGSKG